jgi:uncharacterized protein (DUF2147 family)
MTRFVAIAVAAFGLGLTLPAQPAAYAADLAGVWLTDTADAQIRMATCGADMCGTVVWLKTPNDPHTGRPLTDSKNPDPARRSRPMIGTMIAVSFHPSSGEPNKYIGHFYNAEDGNTYNGSIFQSGADELKVTGCLLVFCQTQTWTRVPDRPERRR